MAETPSHKRAKGAAAGRKGQTEKPLKYGKRLDAVSPSGKKATEVERSGTTQGLKKAVLRLKSARAPQKVLQVPQPHMPKATNTMRSLKVKGTVKNMAGTKRISVFYVKSNT